MSFALLVHEKYYLLTQSEKKVADYILIAGPEIVFQTMGDIKKHTKVGDATIIRFCQKLGFSGFSDLKIEIAKEDFNNEGKSVKQDAYLARVDKLYDVLNKTAHNLNKTEVKKVVAELVKAKNIYIFGVGGSGHSSCELESMFLRVGIKAHSITDPHYQAQVASVLDEQDLVIVFSLSGKTLDILETIKIARANQVKIVAITTYLNSPVATAADFVLQTAVDEFLNGGSLSGKLSQLLVCDLLIWEYEQQQKIDTVALREKVLRSILNKRTDR